MIWLIIAFRVVKLAQIYIFACMHVSVCVSACSILYVWFEFYFAWTQYNGVKGYMYLSHYWFLVLWFVLRAFLGKGNYSIFHRGCTGSLNLGDSEKLRSLLCLLPKSSSDNTMIM